MGKGGRAGGMRRERKRERERERERSRDVRENHPSVVPGMCPNHRFNKQPRYVP